MTRRRWGLVLLMLVFAIAMVILEFTYEPLASRLCQEDGVIEWGQALMNLGAAVLFGYVGTRRGFRNIWYWGYALLFFLLFGEEISWGQRIFGLVTPPSLNQVNVQGETNFHNVDGIHQHIRMLGLLVCLAICYLIPLADRYVPRLNALIQRLRMPVFPLWAGWIVAMSIVLMAVPRLVSTEIFDIDEVGELYLYSAFFIFGLSAYQQAGLTSSVRMSAAGS